MPPTRARARTPPPIDTGSTQGLAFLRPSGRLSSAGCLGGGPESVRSAQNSGRPSGAFGLLSEVGAEEAFAGEVSAADPYCATGKVRLHFGHLMTLPTS